MLDPLRVLEMAIALVGVFVLLVVAMLLGARYEGALFPVVDTLRPGPITDVRGGIVIDRPQFTKLRGCEYLGVQFFRGRRGGPFENVPIDLTYAGERGETPHTRPTGDQTYNGQWFIGMSRYDFENNSFSVLSHRCHPAYLTQTVWWERIPG